jgi:hypothetical protein
MRIPPLTHASDAEDDDADDDDDIDEIDGDEDDGAKPFMPMICSAKRANG